MKCSWPLNNMDLNCAVPLIRVFFSVVNTIVLHYPIRGWLNPWMQNRRYRGASDTEGDSKLYADFQLGRGLVPLTPVLFKGQLYPEDGFQVHKEVLQG